MKYGYCRISTKKQQLRRQIENIEREYPDAIIKTEVWTGSEINRPEFSKLLDTVKEGDMIIFDEVSRMSRNAEEGFRVYQELYNRGIELVFLKEAYVNTETYRQAISNNVQLTGTDVDLILEGVNKYMMRLAEKQIRIALEQAETELTHIHTRTSEALREAKKRGAQIGRAEGTKIITKKSLENKIQILRKSDTFEGNMTDADLMKVLGLARNTYYGYKAELKKEVETKNFREVKAELEAQLKKKETKKKSGK